MQLQRLLVADALGFSSKGDDDGAARALDASWALDQGLAARAEVTAQLIATAVGRLEVGALRRVGGSSRVWAPRLDEMGSRRRLVDALVLEHGDVHGYSARLEHQERMGLRPWAVPIAMVRNVYERTWVPNYQRLFLRELVALRDATPFARPPAEKPPSSPEETIVSIAIPNLRNAFVRADRLALDAELTGKILRMREERKARSAWPQPSSEIASSRLAGLSWNYRVEGDAMTISLSGEVTNPFPKDSLVLPLSFSSAAPHP